jgi:hypothetical protein
MQTCIAIGILDLMISGRDKDAGCRLAPTYLYRRIVVKLDDYRKKYS